MKGVGLVFGNFVRGFERVWCDDFGQDNFVAISY